MKAVRDPHYFGNHEANSNLRYVEVYEIQADPGEEDDFPEPYQPVQVKTLYFNGHVPASSDVIEADNSDVVIRSRQSGARHGTRGNGVAVAFSIDGGITPAAEAAFNETTDTLTIKAKTSATTWAQMSEALAGLTNGQFVLEATNPGGTVGAGVGSESGTLSGGTDGDWETYGSPYGIGTRGTTSSLGLTVGARLWVIWHKVSKSWQPIDGPEKPRALRGTWLSGTTTLTIDSIVVLDSGSDPREDPLDAAETIEVANIPTDTYSAGQRVYADWSAVNEQWEARPKSGSASETYRAIRGSVLGDVSTTTAFFLINNIIPLAGGLDPSEGDPIAAVVVANIHGQSYYTGESVVALYSPAVTALANWEALKKASGSSDVELINFIFHSYTLGAIAAAARVGPGPTIAPTLLTVEKCGKNVSDHLEPIGETLTVEYREGEELPQLDSGHVYAGEALRIGEDTPVVLIIYCKEWEE